MDRIRNNFVGVLSNGLRLIVVPTDGNVTYSGVIVNAGSRDDGAGLDGLAHFVEHTIFKGTSKWRGWQISNRMELIGGELNAYTTKENVMVYTGAPIGYEKRALELLAELIANANFPAHELDLERGVIIEEINSYRDNPSYAVFDEFDELFYTGNALAHNILGSEETVKQITGGDARNFLERHFAPGNMVAYCVTPERPERIMRLAEKYFGGLNRPAAPNERSVPAVCEPFDIVRNRNNRQANTLIGTRIFGADDRRRYALFILSNLLGGPAMNARLNREMREKRGLVYTVESNVTLCQGVGAFQVYFGTDPEKVDVCTGIVRRELDKLAQATMSDRQFEKTKTQLCGQLLLAGDNRENSAMSLAKSLMRYGEIIDNRMTADRIAAVTAAEMRDVAELIAATPASRLTII